MSAASFAIVRDRLRWMPLDYDFRALPLRRIDGTRKREKKRESEKGKESSGANGGWCENYKKQASLGRSLIRGAWT